MSTTFSTACIRLSSGILYSQTPCIFCRGRETLYTGKKDGIRAGCNDCDASGKQHMPEEKTTSGQDATIVQYRGNSICRKKSCSSKTSLWQKKEVLQNRPAVPFRVTFLRKLKCFLRITHRKFTRAGILQHPCIKYSLFFCS